MPVIVAAAVAAYAVLWPWSSSLARVVRDRGASFIDLWLQANAEVALFAEPRITGGDVADIAVEADGQRIVLRGAVDSVDAWHAASAVARRVPGVRHVRNDLAIVPPERAVSRTDEDVARAVGHALRIERSLDDGSIHAAVDGAIVRLTGWVSDVSDWALASRVARDVVGVRAVDNRLVRRSAELAVD